MTTSLEPVLTTSGLNTVALVLVQVRRLQRRADLVLRGIGDVGVGRGEAAGAVGDDADLEGADLVAVDAGRLLAARGRRGVHGQPCGERRERGGGCAGEQSGGG